MKLVGLNSLVAAGALSLSLAASHSGQPGQQVGVNASNGSASDYQDELKLYMLQTSVRLPKGMDSMEPPSSTTAASNMQTLLDVLGDSDLLARLEGVKHEACVSVQASACPEHFKDLPCDTLNLRQLREVLIHVDSHSASVDGPSPGCSEALRRALMLFDVLAITTPLAQFQADTAAGPLPALKYLFSAINIASPTITKTTGLKPAEGGESTGSTEASTASFVDMNRLKKGRANSSREAPHDTEPRAGILGSAFLTFPGSYLALAGTGGPIASLMVNWLFQVFWRYEELFGERVGSRRSLAPLRTLLAGGHEQRLTLLYRMCGIVLGSRRRGFKMAPSSISVPREHFKRKSYLVGLSRISCDVMTQSAYALYLAELHAIEHANSLKQLLSADKMEYAVPLELYAGGRANFQRLCIAFGNRPAAEILRNPSCSFNDTVFASLEARAEENAGPQTDISLLDAAPADLPPKPMQSSTANKNAYLTFSLLALRGGNYDAVASLLADDASSWWSLIYLIDSRSHMDILEGFKKASRFCRKTVQKLGARAASANEDSILCSSNWDKQMWDKKLHCPSKLVDLQCAALENLYGLLGTGLTKEIGHFLESLAKQAACGDGTAKCSSRSGAKQAPLKALGKDPILFSHGLQRGPAGESLLRVFSLLSANTWKTGKDLINGADGVDNLLKGISALVAERATSILLSRWLPHSVRNLARGHRRRKYSRRHLHCTSPTKTVRFGVLGSSHATSQLRSCLDVLVHPSVFLQLNQLNFTRSELSGARNSAGGLSERLDNIMIQAATTGLPQQLKAKLQSGGATSPKGYQGINYASVQPPKPSTWQEYLKAELLDSMSAWMAYPENAELLRNECRGGRQSNVIALFQDSIDLLQGSNTENLTLIGKVTSPTETSVGRTPHWKWLLRKFLRLPVYQSQHHSFVAITVKIPEALRAVRTIVEIYQQNTGVFENQEVFLTAVADLFAFYEQKSKLVSRGLLGVTESMLVPALHPNYAKLSRADRLRELKESALSKFFRHIWTLIFSVSANNILNAGELDGLEKLFSAAAWQKSINDPFQASSFGMVLMGGDVGLKLFNQLLPKKQKRMLKKGKYGSPAVFASQMQLTGSLLSASGHVGLGTFLHAQSVYFGVMIRRWIQKRTQDRVREVISWLTLGLYFGSSFIQVTNEVAQVATGSNETGQASMAGSCPPMGVCIDSNGNPFIGDPTGSPPLTALQVVLKTGIMASVGVLAGPAIAIYNIAVSNFQILSRIEMAIGNTFKKLITRLRESKTIKNIKQAFMTKQDRELAEKAKAAKKGVSLGDEVEQAVSAFFQDHAQARCQR